MKKFAVLSSLLSVFCCHLAAAGVKTFSVTPEDVHNGFIVERISLASFNTPGVQLLDPQFTAVPALPKGALAGKPADIKVIIGLERKQPFALVQIPAFSADGAGGYRRLKAFSLDITESAAPATLPAGAMAKTTATDAVLASGTWYKVSVPSRGLYKIDYNYIQSVLGMSPASINTGSVRVFGNGGTMLSEDNKVARPADLTENAVWMNDVNNDGTFNPGDYLVFYANGPMAWDKDSVNGRFLHRKHLYADSSYYFISFSGTGKRLTTQPGSLTGNTTVTGYDAYDVHEADLYNPGRFGKEWWGEQFGTLPNMNTSRSFGFNVSGADSIRVRLSLAVRSQVAGSTFQVVMNGQQLGNYGFSSVPLSEDSAPVDNQSFDYRLPVSGSTATFQLTYSPSVNDGIGYLNFIELNFRRSLSFAGGVMAFRDWRSVGAGKVATYQIGNANGNLQVWDITDPLQPVRMNGTLNGGTYEFTQDASRLHEFVAFDGSVLGTPALTGKVDNQNIHGQGPTDFVIVTPPSFKAAADKLADFHREKNSLRTLVVTVPQVYNEFSSGAQDISAIRDMMRYFYTRAGMDSSQMPRYLLLLGDASYDYKNRIAKNSNWVPTYESDESINVNNSFVVDEFFAILDDNENIEDIGIPNTLDVGVGRLPVNSPEEAMAIVDKIIKYRSPASLGPWRLTNTYIGDNEDDAGWHLADAEDMSKTVNSTTNLFNDVKVYLDNYPFVATPGGDRCPDANKTINDQIYKGSFLINFNGHGSIYTLAHERILTADDFNKWKNGSRLPFMVTATCDFARYDHPEDPSAGEKMINKGDGGVIAMLTTTAAVYAGSNHTINTDFLQAQFNKHNGHWNTFGDAYRISKNKSYSKVPVPDLINFRRFILLGDPALQPSFPQYDVQTDSIIDLVSNRVTDSLKALGAYKVTGSVIDDGGQLLSGFNGRIYVTIFDKPRSVSLITKVKPQHPRNFSLQDNVIYKGAATVVDGRFSFSFIAPKDINYDFGKCKISYYAENGQTDAAGTDTNTVLGGFSDHPVVDNDGPVVKPYINDTLFRDGGLTGSNTMLFVKLYDETGINVSGNGIGHDLTAILDGDVSHPYNLNDYYETAPNSYQLGYVRFPVTGLSNGKHSFRVRAWDVNNNSGEGVVNFEVADGNVMQVDHLMNYPNPFSDVTHFVFEHNHPNEVMKVQIAIYNSSGLMMRLLEQTYTPTGSHSNELTWDGTDGNGSRLPNGLYPYRMIISTEKGIEAAAYQKLVIMR